MLIERITPDFVFADERGSLTQLVRDGYKQFNIIFSHKGVVRGNHYHKENKEAFYVISGKLTLTAEKDGVKETADFGAGEMFGISENVIHSFFYDEDTWLASMYSCGVEKENGEKDIYS